MKMILPLLLMAIMVSCESIKGLFDVDFETTLSGDLEIEVDDAGVKAAVGHPFSSQTIIDPTEDDDVRKNLEKIVNITADSIVAEIINVSKDDVVFLAGTTIKIYDDESEVSWTLMNDWPIVVGDVVKLQDVEGLYNAVSDILSKKKEFKVSITGECTQSGVYVKIRIEIDTTVTGNPL